jgi:hypothetical protein
MRDEALVDCHSDVLIDQPALAYAGLAPNDERLTQATCSTGIQYSGELCDFGTSPDERESLWC